MVFLLLSQFVILRKSLQKVVIQIKDIATHQVGIDYNFDADIFQIAIGEVSNLKLGSAFVYVHGIVRKKIVRKGSYHVQAPI